MLDGDRHRRRSATVIRPHMHHADAAIGRRATEVGVQIRQAKTRRAGEQSRRGQQNHAAVRSAPRIQLNTEIDSVLQLRGHRVVDDGRRLHGDRLAHGQTLKREPGVDRGPAAHPLVELPVEGALIHGGQALNLQGPLKHARQAVLVPCAETIPSDLVRLAGVLQIVTLGAEQVLLNTPVRVKARVHRGHLSETERHDYFSSESLERLRGVDFSAITSAITGPWPSGPSGATWQSSTRPTYGSPIA